LGKILGFVLKNKKLVNIVVSAMITRLIKNMIRSQIRKTSQSAEIREVVAKIINGKKRREFLLSENIGLRAPLSTAVHGKRSYNVWSDIIHLLLQIKFGATTNIEKMYF
jgi:hypothetical protein